jgi:inhibitor of nuclear factor kappa-B kinase subunit alpha
MPSEQSKRDLIIGQFCSGKSASEIAKKFKDIVNKSTVYRTINSYKLKGKTIRKAHDRKRPKRNKAMLKRIREKVRRNPARSMRQLAKDEVVSTTTMWRAMKNDLKLFPFKKRGRQLLSEATKKKRLERGRQILKKLKQDTSSPVLWTDEKLFTVQAIYNPQNDRVYSKSKEDVGIEVLSALRCQKPAGVMVWAGITTDGRKTPLVFLEEGVKVDTGVYLNLLMEYVLPWVEKEYQGAPLVFQQDGAPSHTSKLVQEFCKDLFFDFWPKDLWPPSSPDLNPMDFAI